METMKRANEIIEVPISLEDEDRIIMQALERLNSDRRFNLTPGQEETLQRAAEAEETAIRQSERII